MSTSTSDSQGKPLPPYSSLFQVDKNSEMPGAADGNLEVPPYVELADEKRTRMDQWESTPTLVKS